MRRASTGMEEANTGAQSCRDARRESHSRWKETEIGLLPADWEIRPLGDLAANRTSNRDPRDKPDETFRYVEISGVSSESHRIETWRELKGAEAPSRARKIIKAGDTLFATVRPYLRNIAQVPSNLDDEICTTGFCVLRTESKQLDPDYLYFYVLTNDFVNRVVAHQRGSSYPAVSNREVLSELIPLPSLPEQRRIAAALSTIQEAIAIQDDVIAAARELKRSLMERLFTYGPGVQPALTKETEIGEVPEHWEVLPLGQVLESTQYGTSERADLSGRYPVLRMNNLDNGRIDNSDLKYMDLDGEELEKYRLQKGDVVFNRTNSFELVGKTALFDLEGDYVFASYLVRVVPEATRLMPGYLNYYLNWQRTQRYLRQVATRGASQSNISPTKLGRLKIALPDTCEQERSVEVLQDVDAKVAAEEQRKAALEELFRSTLDQLMTGQIRLDGEKAQ